MSWARFDDRFHDHRKTRRVWRRCPAAIGLHVMAVTYCAGHETDGRVDIDFVEHYGMVLGDGLDDAVAALVDAGMWEPDSDGGGGWVIHDYLDYNPSRESQNDQREARTAAARKAAEARWERERARERERAAARDPQCDSRAARTSAALRSDAPTRPDPSRPVPDPSKAEGQTFPRAQGSTGKKSGSLVLVEDSDGAERLLEGFSVAELERVMRPAFRPRRPGRGVRDGKARDVTGLPPPGGDAGRLLAVAS